MKLYQLFFCILILGLSTNCKNSVGKGNSLQNQIEGHIHVSLESKDSILVTFTVEQLDSFYIKDDKIIGISLNEEAFKKVIENDTGKINLISIKLDNNKVYTSKWIKPSANILAAMWSTPYYSRKNKQNYITLNSCRKDGEEFNCTVKDEFNFPLLNEIENKGKAQRLVTDKDLKKYEIILNYNPRNKEVRAIILNR